MSTEREAFLRQIIANPADDLCRLIFADYLDERGDLRGEFIRVQCQIAQLIGDGTRCYACNWPISSDGSGCKPRNCSYRPSERSSDHDSWLKRQKHFHELCCCERELLNANIGKWCPLPAELALANIRTNQWHRGFLEHIFCDWPSFARHADAIRKQTPLRAVTLTDRPVALRDAIHPSPQGLRLSCRHDIHPASMTIEEMLSAEWPGITFTLPSCDFANLLPGPYVTDCMPGEITMTISQL